MRGEFGLRRRPICRSDCTDMRQPTVESGVAKWRQGHAWREGRSVGTLFRELRRSTDCASQLYSSELHNSALISKYLAAKRMQ